MSILDRRRGRARRAAEAAGEPRDGDAEPRRETTWAPRAGAYLTDGGTLFRVEHTLADNVNGELFLELEDCSTLEVVLCPARAIGALGLRAVMPALAG